MSNPIDLSSCNEKLIKLNFERIRRNMWLYHGYLHKTYGAGELASLCSYSTF